jgi:hypothetical protein
METTNERSTNLAVLDVGYAGKCMRVITDELNGRAHNGVKLLTGAGTIRFSKDAVLEGELDPYLVQAVSEQKS